MRGKPETVADVLADRIAVHEVEHSEPWRLFARAFPGLGVEKIQIVTIEPNPLYRDAVAAENGMGC